MSTKFMAHSICCNAHWELVVTFNDDSKAEKVELICEKCGKDAGPNVEITFKKDDNDIIECNQCKKDSELSPEQVQEKKVDEILKNEA